MFWSNSLSWTHTESPAVPEYPTMLWWLRQPVISMEYRGTS